MFRLKHYESARIVLVGKHLVQGSSLERISKKMMKNEAKTTKPDTEWKSVEKTKSRQSPSVKASANSDVMYFFTSAQDGNPIQDDVRLCLSDDLKKAQDHSQGQIQALIDKKKVIITETSIRSDLHLEDAGGTDCLPTATIFEELVRMRAKSTAWNESSSTMDSLIICLATNQKFNMSKYIFDAMDILKMEMEMEIPSVKASANSDVMYSFTSAQDGNPLQDDVRLCLGNDLKKAQDHCQRQA
ncbi:hypothetical protein Tco_1184039 [Tanacetum coccineum]